MECLVELLVDENVIVVAGLEARVFCLQLLVLCLQARQLLVEIVYGQFESLGVHLVLFEIVQFYVSVLADFLVLEYRQLLNSLVHEIQRREADIWLFVFASFRFEFNVMFCLLIIYFADAADGLTSSSHHFLSCYLTSFQNLFKLVAHRGVFSSQQIDLILQFHIIFDNITNLSLIFRHK